MITLAHLSDLHLAPLPPVSPRELMSKRITGWLNWRFNRADYMERATLSALAEHLKTQQADLVAITGDLTNLALDAEFDNAAGWLSRLGPPGNVCVIPGNHDAYVRGGLDRARAAWGAYMQGETLDAEPFPYVRRIGNVAVVACSSAVATPPLFAAGRFDEAQADRLARILTHLGNARFFRVVLIHHPPNAEFESWRLGLWGAKTFREVVAQTGAELILHGHTHRSSVFAVPGKDREVPVIGVAAASADVGGREDPARYNLFRIEEVGDAWSCTLREYGYQRIGNEIVMRLQMRVY